MSEPVTYSTGVIFYEERMSTTWNHKTRPTDVNNDPDIELM